MIRVSPGLCRLAAVLSACAILVAAQTGPSDTLKGAFFPNGADPAREAAAYVSEDGRLSLVLDWSGAQPLLRIGGSREVFALKPVPGPRGDTVFKSDAGQNILRASALGGLTLFPDRPEAAAPLERRGPATRLSYAVLHQTPPSTQIAQALDAMRRSLGRPLTFDRPASEPHTESFFADIAVIAELGLIQSERWDAAAAARARLTGIVVVRADSPRAYVRDDRLILAVDPAAGFAGRPSSTAIVQALIRAGAPD
ncbi:MAG: DUF4908 domain-containing protein [Maricaulaceae bacterium]